MRQSGLRLVKEHEDDLEEIEISALTGGSRVGHVQQQNYQLLLFSCIVPRKTGISPSVVSEVGHLLSMFEHPLLYLLLRQYVRLYSYVLMDGQTMPSSIFIYRLCHMRIALKHYGRDSEV